ncbi:MAG: PIN domain-containing protein [Betaproteobacteria bacterium]|nr:PIN domain-containing protein [Betaproteobacteria bacterium]
MARKNEAYVDTSALIAFVDRSDSHHTLFRQLFSSPPPLFTSTLVVAEGHGWFLKRYDRLRALQFLALIEDLKPLRVHAAGPAELAAAAALLRRFSDQELTLVDALGLHLMLLHKTKCCWSTDRHLRLTGTPLVIDEL